MEEKLIVALEIGSSKIKGAVGSVDAAGNVTVKAIEEEKFVDSVRYGLIRNVAEVADAVSAVISRLETRIPGYKISAIYTGIGGRSLRSDVVRIDRRLPSEMEISSAMIEDLFKEALDRHIDDRKVIDVTPREFRVDNAPTNRPVGTFGHHLDAKLNLISIRNQIWRNLNHVIIDRLNLRINDFFVRQIAEADLVLTTEEKRLGCALVDFGAETTTVSVYKHGVLQGLTTLPLGSRNITRDICALNHLEERAEELKISGGNAQPGTESQPSAMFSNASGYDYTDVNNFVAARAGEIIANIIERISSMGFTADHLPGGIIIIGRGARLNNFNQRLASEFGREVRAGQPGTSIRVTDSRITPSDAVDVLAILTAAAANPATCVEKLQDDPVFFVETNPQPAPVNPNPTPVVTDSRPIQGDPVRQSQPQPQQQRPQENPVSEKNEKTPVVTDSESDQKERPTKPGFFGGLFNKFKNRVADLISEPEYEDDEDDDDDERK